MSGLQDEWPASLVPPESAVVVRKHMRFCLIVFSARMGLPKI